jgi:activator of HSP90 ATPase
MTSHLLTRREVSVRLVSLLSALGFAGKARAMTGSVSPSQGEEISHNCECIHQEVVIQGGPARVYQALTNATQFGKITEFSTPGAGSSTTISPEAGGAFSLFGGVILGRHIELVPNERIVQAWREKSWAPGVYSVARFQLNDQGSSTRLVFDHTGFPQGAAGHLAPGWKSHYWEPLQKYLA